jgi:hypothetical protein
MDQMKTVLDRMLHIHGSTSVTIKGSDWSTKLLELYRTCPELYDSSRNISHLKAVGDANKSGTCTELGLTIFVRVLPNGTSQLPGADTPGNHWVSVVINVTEKSILYGDPFQHAVPLELVLMLQWWLRHYDTEDYTTAELVCGHQDDAHSCGLLSFNAMAHKFLPDIYPLICPKACDAGRVEVWIRIIGYLKEMVSNSLSRSSIQLIKRHVQSFVISTRSKTDQLVTTKSVSVSVELPKEVAAKEKPLCIPENSKTNVAESLAKVLSDGNKKKNLE